MVGLACVLPLACAYVPDESPPVVQNCEVAGWVVEDEDVELKVNTLDDRGVKQVYVQFESGENAPLIINLTKTHSEKNGGEKAEWELSTKLPPKEYVYSIVAKDTINETIVDGKISVYPRMDENIIEYVLKKNLTIEDNKRTELENKFLREPDKYTQEIFDYYISEVNKHNQELAIELKKLPDFKHIEIKDVEAVEDILDLTKYESVFGTTFETIFNEGIKDKRKYCSPLEALVWIMYDYERAGLEREKPYEKYYQRKYRQFWWDENDYALMRLVRFSWEKSSSSLDPQLKKWENFDEVVDRLNSPSLYYLGARIIKIETEIHFGPAQTPEKTFRTKLGDCDDRARLVNYCLLKNGYLFDNFETNETNAVCGLSVFYDKLVPMEKGSVTGHAVCLLKMNGLFYVFNYDVISGPVTSIGYLANNIAANPGSNQKRSLGSYVFRDINWKITKRVYN